MKTCRDIPILVKKGQKHPTLYMNTQISFAEYNQYDTKSLNLFIYVRRSTCFRRFFRPSSGAQNCTYSVSLAKLAAGSSIGLTKT